jgi:hypothetical protein
MVLKEKKSPYGLWVHLFCIKIFLNIFLLVFF